VNYKYYITYLLECKVSIVPHLIRVLGLELILFNSDLFRSIEALDWVDLGEIGRRGWSCRQVDPYFTVQPHSLIRQHLDYGHWYDRTKLTLKEIHNTQYLSCMNPTAGSFTIDARLLRHFNVFALSFPGQDALLTIYSNILSHHLALASFPIVSFWYLFLRWVVALVVVCLNRPTRYVCIETKLLLKCGF